MSIWEFVQLNQVGEGKNHDFEKFLIFYELLKLPQCSVFLNIQPFLFTEVIIVKIFEEVFFQAIIGDDVLFPEMKN